METINGKKHKILIVDDSELNRAILTDILENEFEIVEAENGLEAINYLEEHSLEVSLVLLDMIMPVMDGMSTLETMNKREWIRDIPVISISADQQAANVEKAYNLGVTDFIHRPFDSNIVYRRVVNTIMLYAKQKRLEELVTDQVYERSKNNRMLISILSQIVEFRNGESGAHCLNISTITEKLLNKLMEKTDKYGLTKSDIPLICTASSLHDVGKIAIPETILNKPGRLTDEEFAIMKTHSAEGAKILSAVPIGADEPLFKCAYEIARWHHERYDGRGYPDGLVGEKIPISAQVVSIADVYDALTSERCYKAAFTHEKALEMILNNECGVFNPLLIECLVEIAPSLKDSLGKETALFDQSNADMKNITSELFMNQDLSTSNRSLQLLETEREKFDFFWETTRELFFVYYAESSTLKVSKSGEWIFKDCSLIVDPLKPGFLDNPLNQVVTLQLDKILNLTSYEYTDFKSQFEYEGSNYRIAGKTVWEFDGDDPILTSIYGRLEEV